MSINVNNTLYDDLEKHIYQLLNKTMCNTTEAMNHETIDQVNIQTEQTEKNKRAEQQEKPGNRSSPKGCKYSKGIS